MASYNYLRAYIGHKKSSRELVETSLEVFRNHGYKPPNQLLIYSP